MTQDTDRQYIYAMRVNLYLFNPLKTSISLECQARKIDAAYVAL